ncbi:MAG: hypothetical protein IKY90_03515 [Oscillospiraceae bacterium]|nr:hypothetical protein [Oscillospiraceae bacterium]
MKKTGQKLLLILAVVFGVYLFLIAPRMFSKPDMSAFENVAFAHRGFFDNENGIPENSLLDIEIRR